MYYRLKLYIILLVHLSRYANNPFAQKSISKTQFENFQKQLISPAHLQTFSSNILYSKSDNRL